ncbi:MAG: PQQ-binding-like beta-propeller repeat protein [Planctomycetota bacterium]
MLQPSLFALVLTASLPGSDWPQFRGPDTNGVVGAAKLPESWSKGSNVAWTAKVGSGWAQPIVVGGTVYVAEVAGAGLEAPMGMTAGVSDPRTMKAGALPDLTIEWRLVALDLASGKEKWAKSVVKAKPTQPIHPSNTWATETPAADKNGVYAFFGMAGVLVGFDHGGKELWRADLGTYPWMQGYGSGSSPVLHEGKLYVQSFNEAKAFVACFDTKSGKEVWRVTHEKPGTSWATPLLWKTAKRTELVTSGDKLITGLDLATGKELWKIAGLTGPSLCSFAADAERLYFGQRGPGSNPPLYAFPAGQSGDCSPAQGSRDAKGQAWLATSASPGMPSPVAAEGLLYLASENVLTCRDAATGEEIYEERLPSLHTIAASPIIVGDRLLLLDEEGHAAWVPLGPEFEPAEAGTLEDLFWSTPVVAGDALLLRGASTVYCVRK